MSDADDRIRELERQVALLRAQLGEVQALPNSSVEGRLRALVGDRMVLDALPGIVNVLDRDQRIVYLNRTIPGRDVAEFYGTDARMYVHADEREEYSRAFDNAWQSETPTRLLVRTLSGRLWESTFVPVKDAGEVVFMLVTSVDVTDRLQAEQALRDSEARLRVALSASGMGAWSYHVADDLVTWDEVTAGLFGVSLEQAPRSLSDYLGLIHPDDRERIGTALRRYLETGELLELEHRALLPNGSVRYLLGKGTVWRDEAGSIIGLRGGVFDITTRRELESKLELAQRMEAVGQLTSGIAHNLNNVLAIIIPSVDEAMELASGELAEVVDGIGHAARRGAEMVRQLTLFARPHAGAAKGPFDLTATVSRIVDMCQRTFERHVVVTLDAVDVPPVQGNEGQIEQVVLNLCLNARDAVVEAEPAEPRIEVTVSMASPEQVRIVVRDNGVGMEESVRARVFEPFFTTKGVGYGTGLGLATAYAVVVDHQGQIRCTSEPGTGTTFEIEFPVAQSGGASRASVPPQAELAPRNARVLVVEDEAPVRTVIVRMLDRAGYRVTACADGREALELVEGGDVDFDAILLDRSMPGVGGDQVMARLQTLHVTTPVILLTGDPSSAASIPGVSMVLGKPIGTRGLLGNLRRVLDAAATSSRAS